MSVLTHELTQSILDDTQAEQTARDIIRHSLEAFTQLPEEEKDRQLAMLVMTGRRLGLPDYARAGQINEYLETVPGAAEFVQTMHDTAEQILHDETLTDESAVMVVNDLGLAADITQDPTILEDTLRSIVDTTDHSFDMLKRALQIAHDENRLFGDVFRSIKSGKPTVKAAYLDVPMSKRPDFVGDDAVFSTWTRKLGSPATKAVTMDSYDDLFGDVRPTANATITHEFTTDDVRRTTIRRALDDFTAEYKTDR